MSIVLERQASSKPPRLDLPFLPDTAELTPTPRGWVYCDSGRVYRLDGGTGRGGACRGLLECYIASRYAVRWADWSLPLERAEIAALLAQGDAELEVQVRKDILILRLGVNALKIRTEIDSIDCEPDLPRPWGLGPRDEADLVISGLDRGGRDAVRRFARKLGGRVREELRR
jgi:hypothetical protein